MENSHQTETLSASTVAVHSSAQSVIQTTTRQTPSMAELEKQLQASSGLKDFFKHLSLWDFLLAALLCIGAVYVFQRFSAYMDIYEKIILVASVPSLVGLAWFWKPLRLFIVILIGVSLFGIMQYDGTLANASQRFWLKWFLSSQTAILWMCVMFFLATLAYWVGLLARSTFALKTASAMCWVASMMGFVGMMIRWYESYLMATDKGHIPISNLYEVFILFALITALFYLYYEQKFHTRQLGAFVLLIIAGSVGFLLWYSATRDAAQIQGLVPALQSWWMKIHVPANFIGYGTFSLAAMVAWVYLIKNESGKALWIGLVALPLALLALSWLGVQIMNAPALQVNPETPADARKIFDGLVRASKMMVGLVTLFGLTIVFRKFLSDRLPPNEVLEDVMYKAISIGFIFFTIATILGAMWAADAWGGYWSWDPKETWALVVWLNYAAWLHMRLMKGLRGQLSAWWSLAGLLVTTFAFLGVNMFLSGLHSYGSL